MSRSGILVVTELFLPTKGGTAVWFDEVYRRLGGKEIHVVTADVPGAAAHDACHPNSVHRVGLKRRWWLRPESLGMYWNLLRRSLRLAAKHRFTAVHAGRVLPEGLVAVVVGRLFGLPAVIYAHGEEITTWRQPMKRRVMRLAYRAADVVVANSLFTGRQLGLLGVPEDRIRLISPGVNLERFRPGLDTDSVRGRLGISIGADLILSVGRLSRRKGFDQVIRAIASIGRAGIDVHYAIVGIGGDRQYLGALAEDCGVADRVHFLEHVSEDELPLWYNAAQLFVMPNRSVNGDTEGFGMVFLESAACGKPAIAGRAGGTADAVVEGVTGLLVDGESIDEVSASIRRLLDNDELRHRLGKAGFARVERESSWERVAEKTASLLAPTRPDTGLGQPRSSAATGPDDVDAR